MYRQFIGLKLLTAGIILAAHGGEPPTPAGSAEVRTLSETIPAGGTVQVKYLLTQPRPISTGGPRIRAAFSVNGISAFSPLGDTAGVALLQDGMLSINIVSPQSDYGTNVDYPFLTVAMTIPQSTPSGSTFPLGFVDASYKGPAGPLTLTDSKPGTLTIGGSLSIHGITPGGGRWPAGTVLKVQGTGFQPTTKISSKMKTSNAVYVNPSEMDLSLNEAVDLDNQPITATNADGSKVTFYSYLRGVPIYEASRLFLRNVEPIFQSLTHASATVGPLGGLTTTRYAALAIQNPTSSSVAVTLSNQRTGARAMVVVPSGGRVMDDLSSLLHGGTVITGDVIKVVATLPVQIVGIVADEHAGAVTPFLPPS